MKICHMTSAHYPEDIRIFHKECTSLAEAGHEVYLVTCGESYTKNNVNIVGVGEIPGNRIKRMVFGARIVYKKALELDCDVYHFHDPELLPYGLKLKRKGKRVIFDSHEDIPAQIEDKYWIPRVLRAIVSSMYRRYETKKVARFDAVVAATQYIAEQFYGRAKKVVTVNNYPILGDIEFQSKPFAERDANVCYAGGISEIRGEKVMVDAMKNVDGTLILAGDIPEKPYGEGCGNVKYLGRINREQVNELYKESVVGLCVLLPTGNYINSQPIKVFEYMAAGLPIVASDFDAWSQYIEGAGIQVPANNPEKTAEAIQYLLDHRQEAQQMGQCGRKKMEKLYVWESEARTLCELYDSLCHA